MQLLDEAWIHVDRKAARGRSEALGYFAGEDTRPRAQFDHAHRT